MSYAVACINLLKISNLAISIRRQWPCALKPRNAYAVLTSFGGAQSVPIMLASVANAQAMLARFYVSKPDIECVPNLHIAVRVT